MATIPDIDISDFNFKLMVKEAIDILANKTSATDLRAMLYEDFYPNGVLEFDQTPLITEVDPTDDNHSARKGYVDKVGHRGFFFGVLNE